MGYRDYTYYQLFADFNKILSEHDVCVVVSKSDLEIEMEEFCLTMSLPLEEFVEWRFFGFPLRVGMGRVGAITMYRKVIEDDIPLLNSQVHDDDTVRFSLQHLPENLCRRIERACDKFFQKHDILVAFA